MSGPRRDEELALIDEKRMRALYHKQAYQRKIARAFNKKVKPINIKEGYMILKQAWPILFYPRGKFKSNWDGPYIVERCCKNIRPR